MKHKFIKTISALFLSITLIFSSSIFAFADSADKWVPRAPMATGRQDFQTVVINNKIYALGGYNPKSSESTLASVEEYDPATDTWTTKAPMTTARSRFQAVVINNKIYAIGGFAWHSSDSIASVEEYDPDKNTWITKRSMNIPRCDFKVEVFNGKIYAIGGERVDPSYGILNSVEEYDPETNTWTMKASMSNARGNLNTTLIDGKIYAVGGVGKTGEFQKQIEAYDIQNDKWSSMASLDYEAKYAQLEEVNGKIYIIGGACGEDVLHGTNVNVEEYDPLTNICSIKASMQNIRESFPTVTDNGHIFAIGGDKTNTMEEYDPQADKWTQKAAVSNANYSLYRSCANVINSVIYLIGGVNDRNCDKTWSYNISANTPSLTVTASPNKVKVGQQFTTDIAIHNETNICAEDIKLTYDKNLFEYEGATGQTGTKIYKEDTSTPGTIRFITACQGKDNAATGDKGLITLKFKAKAKGVGKVDIIKGRIADNATLEEDVADENCGEDTITVDGYQDVNRSGNFTLLDLGIDAYYDGLNASDTDSTKYDADVVPDGKIDDNDLAQITQEILANKDYAPNNY